MELYSIDYFIGSEEFLNYSCKMPLVNGRYSMKLIDEFPRNKPIELLTGQFPIRTVAAVDWKAPDIKPINSTTAEVFWLI